MALQIESARLLTWRAAALKDSGKPFSKVLHFQNSLQHLLFYEPMTDLFDISASNIDYNMYNYSCAVRSHSLVYWIPRMLNTKTGKILYAENHIVCYTEC